MRYYVLCVSDEEGVAPYLLAEVVRDAQNLEEDRDLSIAGALAGARATIATREELVAGAIGQAALDAWDSRDDSQFDCETVLLGKDKGDRKVSLRLVWNASRKTPDE